MPYANFVRMKWSMKAQKVQNVRKKYNYMAFNKWACLKVFLEDMTTRGKLERIDGRKM